MKTYTLQNNFHNSHTTIRVKAPGIISKRQAKRASDALCGIGGC